MSPCKCAVYNVPHSDMILQPLSLITEAYERTDGVLNRAWHVGVEKMIEIFVHEGPRSFLSDPTTSFEVNDYAVLDNFLDHSTVHSLSQLLLQSSVWFDSTNGQMFATHPDDGLPFTSFQHLAEVCGGH